MRNKLTAIAHDLHLPNLNAEHQLVEILPNKQRRCSIFLLNVYSAEKRSQRFALLFAKAATLAGCSPLIIAGDFNAPHTAWGYRLDSRKGRDVMQASEDIQATLLTDANQPTRIGTSCCRDTTPDLTFSRNITCEWSNTSQNIGSDHFILQTTGRFHVRPERPFRYVNWESFRRSRDTHSDRDETTVDEWTSTLRQDIDAATNEIQTTVPCPSMDNHLAHLLEAHSSLLRRWRQQRLNRRLRKRIAELNRTIHAYCDQLSQQQWNEVCEQVDANMRMGKKWSLLKNLINKDGTRARQRQSLNKTIHRACRTREPADVYQDLARRYLPLKSGQEADYPAYNGRECTELDTPITEAEVRYALNTLKSGTAPGPDKIPNTALRNLDDASIRWLTQEFNRIWEHGDVPDQWKRATVVLIPKPGKPDGLEHMRPISLTSNVGKVLEHVINLRVSRFCENHTIWPHTMFGFRPSLCTQDILVQIRQDILLHDTRDTQAILAIDLEKAFDRVSHRHILEAISETGLGNRFHAYISSFLKDRTALIRCGDLPESECLLGDKGTPQGAVLSPLLFNLAMLRLAKALEQLTHIHYALYADDLTIWCTGGSDGHVESVLQEAVDTVEKNLAGTGLRCSQQKSELLLYRPTRRGRKPAGWVPTQHIPVRLTTGDGGSIPCVTKLRVLGVIFEANGHNSATLDYLKQNLQATTRLLLRVSNSKSGLKEHNALRIVNAFLISRVAYAMSILKWHASDIKKLNNLLRMSIKRALGLPRNTSTQQLERLGISNSVLEMIDAQTRAQYGRLSSTLTGRHVLQRLGIHPALGMGREIPIPPEIREQISFLPLPRRMHPEYHQRRRLARAQALTQQTSERLSCSTYVDAAQNARGYGYTVVAMEPQGSIINTLTSRKLTALQAEQVAIAIALLDPTRPDIYSDSKTAIKAFTSGYICETAARILRNQHITAHHLYWFPGHVGSLNHPLGNPNETVHRRARDLTYRVANRIDALRPEAPEFREVLTTYNECLLEYQMMRRIYPLPHRSLARAASTTLRMLQTNSYPSLARLHIYLPDAFPENCPRCSQRGTLEHMLWECPSLPPGPLRTQQEWRRAVTSTALEEQLLAVQRAHDMATELRLPIPSWPAPASP